MSTNQIASVTSKDLHKLKLLVTKSEKQKQLQVEKLEENFKEAINRYYTLQKVFFANTSMFPFEIIVYYRKLQINKKLIYL